jgi:hypothetical protein
MAILIYSEQENANVGLPAAIINGVHRQSRSYASDGHTILVDDPDAIFVSEDAELIIAQTGFRLATSTEQEDYTKAQAQVSKGASIKESKGAKSTDQSSSGS